MKEIGPQIWLRYGLHRSNLVRSGLGTMSEICQCGRQEKERKWSLTVDNPAREGSAKQ